MLISANCMVCGNSFSFVLNFPHELDQKFCPRCMARYPLLSLYPSPFPLHDVSPGMHRPHPTAFDSPGPSISPASPVSPDSSDSQNISARSAPRTGEITNSPSR